MKPARLEETPAGGRGRTDVGTDGVETSILFVRRREV